MNQYTQTQPYSPSYITHKATLRVSASIIKSCLKPGNCSMLYTRQHFGTYLLTPTKLFLSILCLCPLSLSLARVVCSLRSVSLLVPRPRPAPNGVSTRIAGHKEIMNRGMVPVRVRRPAAVFPSEHLSLIVFYLDAICQCVHRFFLMNKPYV